jgi:hypothetical protein
MYKSSVHNIFNLNHLASEFFEGMRRVYGLILVVVDNNVVISY